MNNWTQQTIVNTPPQGGFGIVQFDYKPDGVQITFMSVDTKGHVEDRVAPNGERIYGVASQLLNQSHGYKLRVVA